MDFDLIRAFDPELAASFESELRRQRENIELIASENYVSPAVMAAMGSIFTNKYAEGYPGRRYYGGCEDVDVAENLARDRACALYGAEHANVQPHSGAQANAAVYFALLKPGDTIMGMALDNGGHLTHGSPANLSGAYFNVIPYGVSPETGRIDYDDVLRLEPYNLAALFFRAYANEKLNRLNFARLDYETLLTIVPGHFEAQLGLALLNFKDKHFTEAIDMANRLVSQYPDSAVAYAARAGMELERGMCELAEYDYTEALRRDSANTDYLLSRADLRIRMRLWDAARRDLDTLVALGIPQSSLKAFYRRLRR